MARDDNNGMRVQKGRWKTYNLYSLAILQRYFGIYSYIIHTLPRRLCQLRELDVETRKRLDIGIRICMCVQ